MMIKFPAPEDPPMRATIRLGTMAKHRVRKFRIHGFSLKSRNPYAKETNIREKDGETERGGERERPTCITYCPAYVPVMVEL